MVKRAKNLWQQIVAMDNLEKAYQKSKKGKGKHKHIKRFEKNKEENLKKIQEMLINQTYEVSRYTSYRTILIRLYN